MDGDEATVSGRGGVEGLEWIVGWVGVVLGFGVRCVGC